MAIQVDRRSWNGLFNYGDFMHTYDKVRHQWKYEDDGHTYGQLLGGGRVGFRQLAPMIAEYANFKVYEL